MRCTDMPAGALFAQVEAFQTVNPVCFLVVNRLAFPPQLNVNTRATVADPGFHYFPDTQGYRPLIPPDTDTVSLPQKMHRLTLLSRPQNFCFSTSCSISLSRLRSATSFFSR
ncbi:Uncharacterised protein [Klebsiella pneumoniae]|nr:Uncharacterised protein [Klebsiella pneumoniae]